jgi:hypothetical protein
MEGFGMNITMTYEEYQAIKRLQDFAQWYVDEHKGGSFICDSQWEEDRDDVERGVAVIKRIDDNINAQYTAQKFEPAEEHYD